MAFPTGWSSKHRLTIDNTKVSGSANLTNFPVYLSGDNFLADVFTKAAARREINANWLLSDANLQGYWRLESDGSDETANNYDLTEVGSPSHSSAKFGNGLDLGTSNSSKYSYISNDLGITGGTIVMSAWVKLTTEISAGNYVFVGQCDNGNKVINEIRYDYNSGNRQIVFVREKAGVGVGEVIYPISMGTTDTFHLLYWYDGTNLKGYVNGVLVGTTATSGNGTSIDRFDRFYIGARYNQSTASLFSSAIIDDVAVFNRALSDYEVKALYYGTADLRFSSDISGSTELASEVVFFDPDNSLAEVHVKVPTVSYNTDTDFYVWYEASSEAPYAPTATYGSQAVWSDYQGVWHFEEYPSVTAPQIKDSTANGNNGTSSGSMTSSDLVSGKIGKALDFDGTNDYIDCGSGASLQLDGNSFTVSMWIKLGQINRFNYPLAKGGSLASNQWLIIGIRENNNWTVAFWNNDLNVAGSPSVETWYHLVATYDTTTNSRKLYLNGSLIGNDTSGSDLTNTNNYSLRIGNYYSDYFLGSVDEVYILNTVHSADWIATEYANQNSPSTFVTESSVVTTVVLNSYKSLLGVGR